MNKNCKFWTSKDITQILNSGNILYNVIGKSTTLLVSELPQHIKLYNSIYKIQEKSSIIGHIFESNEQFQLFSFDKVEQYINNNKKCILIIGNSSISVQYVENKYYTFDPHQRNSYGFPDSNGCAIVLKFNTFQNLYVYICELSKKLNAFSYELIPIEITKYKEVQIDTNKVNKQLIEEKIKIPINNKTEQKHIGNIVTHIEKNKNNNINENCIVENELNKKKTCSTKRKIEDNTSDKHTNKKFKIEQQINNEPKDICSKKLIVKIKDIMETIHKKKNNKVQFKALQDNKKCKKYGYKMKICLVKVKNITKKNKINNNISQSKINNSKLLKDTNKYKYGNNLQETINNFNKLIAEGPIYTCSICQQNQFKDKVSLISKMYNKKKNNNIILDMCRTNYKSIDNKEYICNTCKNQIYKNNIPRISVKNGCIFPNKPEELNLFNLEERFISPVIGLMLIHQLLPGGQLSLYGSICHLPIEIGKVVKTLPRTLNEYETISVKLKRRLCYKNSVFSENVRPQKILVALKYLLNNSELYKEQNININEEWFKQITSTKNTNTDEELNSNNNTTEQINNESDEDDENEELPNAPSVNTLLTENNIDPHNEILCIAPGEGQKPIFTDENTEYLCFPTIFCGQKRMTNQHHRLNKREIFKYEMRSTDRRVATNIPNIFWKTKYKQINQINQQVSFALRRNQSKGKIITAKILLNTEERQKIVKYNDGYKIFKNIRSSPPYFEQKRKDLMAMIRQLGIPTLFISLSAADTKWTQLLQSIYIQTHKKIISLNELELLPWPEKCKLISSDPGTCALYFNDRVKKFIKNILKSPFSPLGHLENFFYRVEFQHRGSPHIHGLLWIKNAPHYERNTDTEIINYIDSVITCSTENRNDDENIQLQIHKHSKTCTKRINHQKKCRFGCPWPPLDKTQILYPLNKDESENKEKYCEIYKNINKLIQLKHKLKEMITFDEILKELNITYELYILALRTSINKKKVFLKRDLSEIFINNYMKDLLNVWKANHDIQYVLDPYSCVVYICDYLMKNNKGMSKLLEAAAKEAREGNMDLKQSVRHIGNKFLNCTEMSEQECAYSLLELPITQSSIKIEFINTSEINDRVFIAKPDYILKNMDPESEDIKQENSVDRYASRPHVLKNMCLADYIALTDLVYNSHKHKIQSEDEMSIDENSSDEDNNKEIINDNDITKLRKMFPLKLKNKRIIKMRQKRKIIRFVNYKYKVDPMNYCREKLMLYIPWEKNEKLILNKFETYIDAYNYFQKEIYTKMKIYEPAAEIIEHALLEYEEHPEKFCPNLQPIIDETITQINKEVEIIDDSYNYLLPEGDNSEYDLLDDLKMNQKNYVNTIITKPNITNKDDFINLINKLNLKQYQFFLYIMEQEIQTTNNQITVCLHGGAGTGKSYVLKAIYQALYMLLNSKPGQNTNDIITLLVAPTGKAAHNIKGHTIHSAFHVPANQNLSNYTKLTWDHLNTYRTKFQNLKWIICDEISMVSNYMLRYIHLRLQEIKSNNLPFGGVNIIAVGDLYQLKPVMGQFIFEDYKTNYGPLATNLWTQHFKIFELDEIMRQKEDKKFAQLLNRLRIGNHNKDDIYLLKRTKKENKHLENKPSIPHFYPTIQQVNIHNKNISSQENNFKIESLCNDVLPQSISLILQNNISAAISKRKITHTGGLPEKILLITNQQYDLITNIDVEDGLINGAQCIIKYIQTTLKDDKYIPYIVWAEFDTKDIGLNYRQKYSYLYSSEQKNRSLTPIIKIKRTFIVKHHWIHRIQFPLRQAAARTIHVSQSSTYPEIFVDLETISTPPKSFWEHMHYVAFSRVTSLRGLYIENINEKNISTSSKVSNYLQSTTAKEILKTENDFSHPKKLNIILHNTRSFKKYFSTIKENKIINKQQINIFLESKLCQHDKSNNYTIPNYIIIRADQKNTTTPHYGIITYIQTKIQINKVEYMSTEKIDTLYTNITFNKEIILIFSIYNSPKNLYTHFEKHLLSTLQKKITANDHIIVIGDFNIQYNSKNYIKLCSEMSKYKLKQYSTKYTTINNTTIDLIFTNLEVDKVNYFFAHWSDHNIIQCQIKI